MPSLLHIPRSDSRTNETKRSSGETETKKTFATFGATPESSLPTRLMVVPVQITNPIEPKQTAFTQCFVDFGSTHSYIKSSLAQSLALEGPSHSSTIITANAKTTHKGRKVSLLLRGVNEREIVQIEGVFTLDAIPDVTESIVRPETNLIHTH